MKPNDLPDGIAHSMLNMVADLWAPASVVPQLEPIHKRTAARAFTPKARTAKKRVTGALADLDSTAAVPDFLLRNFSNAHGAREYLLHVPVGYSGEPVPMIVMLHGCQQGPEDFALGTRMNMLADQRGFLVAYPRQTSRSNGANCWNWFEASEQVRSGQEPSLIAGIVDAVGQDFAVDQSRVFVAGLSAGAAMAVILGQTYPEVFAGVAAHSGLPFRAAHDVMSAFSAMRGQGRADGMPGVVHEGRPIRTFVLHGDADATVDMANGLAITQHAVAAFQNAKQPIAMSARSKEGNIDFVSSSGQVMVRECIVAGGGHAWFGGNSEGSYTQDGGPDASAEIVRFFLDRLEASA